MKSKKTVQVPVETLIIISIDEISSGNEAFAGYTFWENLSKGSKQTIYQEFCKMEPDPYVRKEFKQHIGA